MYLSRVEINVYRHETRKALDSLQVMHAMIMASFTSFNAGTDRVLWRIDKLGPSTYILVQSRQKPDFHHIIDQLGWPGSDQKWDSVEYDSFLSSISNGQMWRFRLKANPVHSVSDKAKEDGRGKIAAHVTQDQQKMWLMEKSVKCGFSVAASNQFPNEYAVDVVQSDIKRFNRDKSEVTVSMVVFEGVLVVEDADLFVKSMISGIGRAKAYGCGLITIMK